MDAELANIVTGHPRLWLLDYGIAADDPQNLPAAWLDLEAYKLESQRFGKHYLTLYAGPGFGTPGVGPEEGAAEFGGQISLRYPLIDARLAGGDLVAVALDWQALTTIDEYYQVFVHISLPGGALLVQQDSAPGNGRKPTDSWQAGDIVTGRRVLRLPWDAAPGRYAVTVGLYRLDDGRRLPVSGGEGQDYVLLGYIQVE
jgi:hypothetical protein